MKSALKASMISSGSLILLLSEREHIIKTQKISKSSSDPRTSTPSGNTTVSKDLEPSETSNLTSNDPEDFPSETNVSSVQNISEETLSTTERSDANITIISEEPTPSALGLSIKQEMVLSPVLLTLQSQLSQVEQDWVEIQAHIPTVQQRLHQVHFSLYFNLSEIIACTASLQAVPWMVEKEIPVSFVWNISYKSFS